MSSAAQTFPPVRLRLDIQRMESIPTTQENYALAEEDLKSVRDHLNAYPDDGEAKGLEIYYLQLLRAMDRDFGMNDDNPRLVNVAREMTSTRGTAIDVCRYSTREIRSLAESFKRFEEKTDISLAHLTNTLTTFKQEMKTSIHCLNEKVDSKFNHIDAKFNQMDAKFYQMDANFILMQTKLNQMDTNFTQMQQKLNHMDTNFTQIQQKLNQMDANYGQMEQKLSLIDSKFSQMEQKWNLIDSKFSQMDAKYQKILDLLENRLNAL